MGFRALRVINDDRVAAGQGFGTHPHRDMEIVTYVLGGAVQHKDSMGNEGAIRPGEVQRMTAGTGVLHSEFNGSRTEPLHLLQSGCCRRRTNLTPSYEQKMFPPSRSGAGCAWSPRTTVATGASPFTRTSRSTPGCSRRRADADATQAGPLRLGPRRAWRAEAQRPAAQRRRCAAVSGEEALAIDGVRDAEVLVFDLA